MAENRNRGGGGRGAPEHDGDQVTHDPPSPSCIGQVALPVDDVERATRFYRDVLGLDHLFSAPPALAFFQCGEVRLMLSEPESPDSEDAPSVLYYEVDDADEAHRALESGGARVVEEPHVVHRTDETELWMAFYRDSEDNVFATMHEAPSTGDAEGA